jgi:DNA-binding SARP family transcriptional activator
LIAEDPLREDCWTRLVLALHHSGRRAEAIEVFERARATLRAELGVEPGAALTAAHRTVLLGGQLAGEAEDIAYIQDLLVDAVRAVQTAVRLADRIGVTVPLSIGGIPA